MCNYVTCVGKKIIYFHIINFQNGLLGVFQKLIASKSQDQEGFRLLKTIIEHCPM